MNAHESYIAKRQRIDREIEILKQKLESMDISEKKDPSNYGWAGNAVYVLRYVEELNYGFLKNKLVTHPRNGMWRN